MGLKNIINREQKKYCLLYRQDKDYGVRKYKPITDIRGNKRVRLVMDQVFKKSNTMLDVGCGRGYYAEYLKNKYEHLNVTGIDIAGKEIESGDHKVKVITCSCNKTPFNNRSFDLVIHLDGLEHIPVELEENTIKEQCRISKRYIYHQISTQPVFADKYWEEQGLGSLHINLKNPKEWERKFNEYSKKFRLKKIFFISYKNWIHILLEKN